MSHYQKHPAETPIIKFKDQDFYSLRDQCLSKGQLFEDETFPAMASSIGPKLLNEIDLLCLQWKRPKDKELSDGFPHFILEGASRFDIQQGRAGDCWVLAALGSLTQNRRCLERIMPKDQSFSSNYAGIFHFQFWQCGRWVDVVVDDCLPLKPKNKPVFVRPHRHTQEFWPCLLEKAYAKLHGSYSHLHFGYISDALVDLTGGVVTHVEQNTYPSSLVMVIKMAASARSLMACGSRPGDGDQELENGLVSRHAYTVTGAERIQYRRGWEDIIRLWNPRGHTEWKGRWSDGSQEWQETHDLRKSQLYENKEDGEFWMSCQDFWKNFSHLYICNQIPISLDHGTTLRERWSQWMMFKNQEGPWRDRPHFSVPEGMEGINAVVSVTMRPQSLRPEEEELPLTFYVKPQRFQERLLPTSSSHSSYAVQGTNLKKLMCNHTCWFQLSPGSYDLVPLMSREDAQFLLRIFLKLPDVDRNLKSNVNLGELKAVVGPWCPPAAEPAQPGIPERRSPQ